MFRRLVLITLFLIIVLQPAQGLDFKLLISDALGKTELLKTELASVSSSLTASQSVSNVESALVQGFLKSVEKVQIDLKNASFDADHTLILERGMQYLQEANQSLVHGEIIPARDLIESLVNELRGILGLQKEGLAFTEVPVSFKSSGIDMTGVIFLPKNLSAGKKIPGIILAGPFSGIKEQVVSDYAKYLATYGFAAMTFDYRTLGASGGEPRQEVIPANQVEDLRAALTFLESRPEVNPNQLGTLGICMGGGMVIPFAADDMRIKAVAGVAGSYLNAEVMRNRLGSQTFDPFLAGAKTDFDNYQTQKKVEYLPLVAPNNGPAFMRGDEPYTYYHRTSITTAPRWKNQVAKHCVYQFLTWDTLNPVRKIAPRPLLIVHGKTDHYCLPEDAQAVFDLAGNPKEIYWIATTNHIDLYDNDHYVRDAAQKVIRFFQKELKNN
ncbi:MAG: alpha/beta hydrolase [Candidatus Riflebacteria bacterium]|nr:alpha/beta hydrolase [Candidatus Riflebacteria bacterium]